MWDARSNLVKNGQKFKFVEYCKLCRFVRIMLNVGSHIADSVFFVDKTNFFLLPGVEQLHFIHLRIKCSEIAVKRGVEHLIHKSSHVSFRDSAEFILLGYYDRYANQTRYLVLKSDIEYKIL